MNTALNTSRLCVRYGQKIALNSIDISISGSGITALLGANGAGKTTLINCALGLCKPSSGSIGVFGKTPGAASTKKLIGVMLQDSSLPDLLSAREHIELFKIYYPDPLSVDELCQRCELGGFIDKRYKYLSGGQKRRVQFALAILGRPKILFLDEPTTGLDIGARKLVWNTITRLSEAGTAVLLTTHYLEEADTLAERTIVMSEGNIIANDTTEKIRAAASGAIIRCDSSLSPKLIETLPRVRSVQQIGRQLEIVSNDAVLSLRELLSLDSKLENLTVSQSSLEGAFLQLTTNSTQSGSAS